VASAFAGIPGVDDAPPTGAYSQGLLAVVDARWSQKGLQAWLWALKPTHRAVMTTGFGDVFLWEPDQGIGFLEVQRGEVEPIDADVRWFLDGFLKKPTVIEQVLRKPRFDELVGRFGPLPYHEAFILRPWPMLGGEDKVENYTTGDCRVYLDLVGQALQPSK
jgi:hypothetical protein